MGKGCSTVAHIRSYRAVKSILKLASKFTNDETSKINPIAVDGDILGRDKGQPTLSILKQGEFLVERVGLSPDGWVARNVHEKGTAEQA